MASARAPSSSALQRSTAQHSADSGPDDHSDPLDLWLTQHPTLYDLLLGQRLEVPSLTAEWLPKASHISPALLVAAACGQLLLGTKMSESDGEDSSKAGGGESARGPGGNYVLVVGVPLPDGAGREGERVRAERQLGHMSRGGKGCAARVLLKVPHEGDVHCARAAPHRPHLIATQSSTSSLYLHSLQHPPPTGSSPKPVATLHAHTRPGFALAWHPTDASYLLSGAHDRQVCLWKVSDPMPSHPKPLESHRSHTKEVNCVGWLDPHTFASAGDDGCVVVRDMRASNPSVHALVKAGSKGLTGTGGRERVVGGILSLECRFSGAQGSSGRAFAFGTDEGEVGVGDLRKMGGGGAGGGRDGGRGGSLEAEVFQHRHLGPVVRVSWCPQDPHVIVTAAPHRSLVGGGGGSESGASATAGDGDQWAMSHVLIWDTRAAGERAARRGERELPPGVLFVHAGHEGAVGDVCCLDWARGMGAGSGGRPWTLASVSEEVSARQQHVLHVWQPAQHAMGMDL